jgi:hypothetical protein
LKVRSEPIEGFCEAIFDIERVVDVKVDESGVVGVPIIDSRR